MQKPRDKYCRSATPLYHPGEDHSLVYLVLEGYVVLDCNSPDGRECIVALLSPGDYFGPGLTGEPANHRALAKPGCRLQVESRDHFQQRLSAQPQLALTLASQLARREARLQHLLYLEHTAELPQRLAWLLQELFNECGDSCRHGHLRDIKLSQQELAAMAGGSRQTVSQLLNDWRREGIIAYTRHYLCLENPQQLKQLIPD